jgi:hypothetical protein
MFMARRLILSFRLLKRRDWNEKEEVYEVEI